MKFTASQSETLKKLDMTVYTEGSAIVGTQHGDVEVRKALTPGYCAELKEDPAAIMGTTAYGVTPALALFNLGDVLRREQEAAKENVLVFVRPAAGTQEAA
jgi:hypothetical protein